MFSKFGGVLRKMFACTAFLPGLLCGFVKFRSFEAVASGWLFQVLIFQTGAAVFQAEAVFFSRVQRHLPTMFFRETLFSKALRAIGTRERTRCEPRDLHGSVSFITCKVF